MILNAKEVSFLAGLKEKTIKNYCGDKKIPHYKDGGKIFFLKTEIELWIASRVQRREKTN